jgi:hypothetical protein
MGVPRVSATLRVGTRTDKVQSLEEKVRSVEEKIVIGVPKRESGEVLGGAMGIAACFGA